MMRLRSAAVPRWVTIVLLVAGCGSASSSSAPPSSFPNAPPTTAAEITLLTCDGELGGPGGQAMVNDVLKVSDSGCVSVGEHILIAPPGSTVEGPRVHIESIGDFELGDAIDTGGSYLELSEIGANGPKGYEQCNGTTFVVIG